MRIYDPESSYWIQFNFVYSKHSEKKNKCYCRERNLFKLFTLIQRLLILIIHQLAISDDAALFRSVEFHYSLIKSMPSMVN